MTTMMIMIIITRLPSNVRQTTRRCMYLVRRGHFRSRDKDGGLTIRSAITENPMLHANFTALSSTERELLPVEVLHSRNREFRAFFSRDLDLDSMTFIYELDPYPLNVYPHTENGLYTLRLSKVIVLHTDIAYRYIYRWMPSKT